MVIAILIVVAWERLKFVAGTPWQIETQSGMWVHHDRQLKSS
ncbi:hypothetical protein QUF63_09100 [Anaerolineales bacterium HSG25]|nr:hypothetical protein [Anaerolineales bacterium HSG25]